MMYSYGLDVPSKQNIPRKTNLSLCGLVQDLRIKMQSSVRLSHVKTLISRAHLSPTFSSLLVRPASPGQESLVKLPQNILCP